MSEKDLLNCSIIEFEKPEMYHKRIKRILTRPKDSIILNHMKEHVFILIDFDTYAFANRAHKNFLGLNIADNISGRKIAELLDKPIAEQIIEKLKHLYEYRIEIVYDLKCNDQQGKEYYFNVRYIPISDIKNHLAYVIGIATDVTDKIQVENLLRLKEVRYEEMIENQQEMICRWLPDTTLLYVNRAYCWFQGMTRDELVGRRFIDFLTDLQQEKFLEKIKKFTLQLPTMVYEQQVTNGHDKLTWLQWRDTAFFDEDGNLIEVQSVGRDITQSKDKEIYLLDRYRVLQNEVDEKSARLDIHEQDLRQLQEKNHILANELQRKQEYFTAVFESSIFSALIINKEMEIILGNARLHFELCLPNEILLGKKITDYIHSDDRDNFLQVLEDHSGGANIEIRLNTRLGMRYCLANVFCINDFDEIILAFKDVTKKHELAEQLFFQSQFQDLLDEVFLQCQTISNNNQLKKFINKIADSIATLLAISHCHIKLYANNKMWLLQYPDQDAGEYINNTYIYNYWLNHLKNNAMYYVNNDSVTSVIEREILDYYGMVSILILPVFHENKMAGYICLGSEDNQEWSQFVLKGLKLISETITLALGRVRLYSQLDAANSMNQSIHEESVERLKKTFTQIVSSLTTALKARNPYTAEHLRKTTYLAMAIAEKMGLAEDSRQAIYLAGSIHDIGKLVIPVDILNKSGDLTTDEYNIIKYHCQAGYEITKEIDFPWPISQIILQHHERLDGSGYPQGLQGDDILLEARVLAVADVVEAMCSHRPYRAALGEEAALNEIMKYKGILYDNEVVDACIELFAKEDFSFATNIEKGPV